MSRRDAAWLGEAIPEKRIGLKGPRATQLLQELQLAVPDSPNTWSPLRPGESAGGWNLVARLGSTEFFVEECDAAAGVAALEDALSSGVDGAYPVLREDFAFVLGGASADDALAQACNVNFAGLALERRPVVMTSMIGVGVLVLPQVSDADGRSFRIWCDPTYGAYLWAELEEIVTRISAGSAQ
jgi:sarcosine oxidase, subunit gamma